MHSSGDSLAAGRVWRCGAFAMPLDRPRVMGILNVTPDSFSDGGAYATPELALERARAMVEAGADIIDVGGESTRPGSSAVEPSEEISRVAGVIAALVADGSVPVSIDTRHAEVARAAVEAGASIVNDVSGFRDPAMVALAAERDVGVVVMHMLGEPGTMQDDPHYGDVVAEVREWLLDRALALEDAGVARDRIVLDPGIGFGKTLEHNIALLRALPCLAGFGYPVLVGASRKRFIGAITGIDAPAERLGGSVAAAVCAVERGAAVVRVHDVGETVQAVRVVHALLGTGEPG